MYIKMADKTGTTTHQTYPLRRYTFRTCLSLFGPLCVLAYYIFICLYYLKQPPVNGIVRSHTADGQYVFYGWVLVSIFILDWAKTGLANFEAAALMDSRFAPLTMMELMWHQDNNWNNVLWWMRGVRNIAKAGLARAPHGKSHSKDRSAVSTPSWLWMLLSFISLLLFTAIPLSGLSFELVTVSTYSDDQAIILGPRPAFFNEKVYTGVSQLIRAAWFSGRVTSPADSSILYAPNGVQNVSDTYYNDVINSQHNESMIQFFTGPAVQETVHGSAWGLQANITCQRKHRDDLRLIKVHGFDDYDALLTDVNDKGNEYTAHVPIDSVNFTFTGRAFKETGFVMADVSYSLVGVATGTWYGMSPYMSNETDSDKFIEAYLWQAPVTNYTDAVYESILAAPDIYTSTTKAPISAEYGVEETNTTTTYIGFGVSCQVSSIMGNATLDPLSRTFSSLVPVAAKAQENAMYSQYSIQIQALASLAGYAGVIPEWEQSTSQVVDGTNSQSTWLSMQYALNNLPYINHGTYESQFPIYPILTANNLTLALHKILGESTIALMASGSQPSWKSTLYTLKPTRYIIPGVIPWRLILALLVAWTICTTITSLWMSLRRRWAPTLNGFELFKFGAQYPREVAMMEHGEFQECRDSLRMIPGMVGSLPGTAVEGEMQFIGLSETQAYPYRRCVLDRTKAQGTRY